MERRYKRRMWTVLITTMLLSVCESLETKDFRELDSGENETATDQMTNFGEESTTYSTTAIDITPKDLNEMLYVNEEEDQKYPIFDSEENQYPILNFEDDYAIEINFDSPSNAVSERDIGGFDFPSTESMQQPLDSREVEPTNIVNESSLLSILLPSINDNSQFRDFSILHPPAREIQIVPSKNKMAEEEGYVILEKSTRIIGGEKNDSELKALIDKLFKKLEITPIDTEDSQISTEKPPFTTSVDDSLTPYLFREFDLNNSVEGKTTTQGEVVFTTDHEEGMHISKMINASTESTPFQEENIDNYTNTYKREGMNFTDPTIAATTENYEIKNTSISQDTETKMFTVGTETTNKFETTTEKNLNYENVPVVSLVAEDGTSSALVDLGYTTIGTSTVSNDTNVKSKDDEESIWDKVMSVFQSGHEKDIQSSGSMFTPLKVQFFWFSAVPFIYCYLVTLCL